MSSGKWEFVEGKFNSKQGRQGADQLGSIRNPAGYWFCAVESVLGHPADLGADLKQIQEVVKVLNRELPGGKPRRRRRAAWDY